VYLKKESEISATEDRNPCGVDKRLHGSLLVWVRLSSVHVSSETAVVV